MPTIEAVDGSGISEPLTVLSQYVVDRWGRNVIHDLIGGGIAVALVPANPRRAQLRYLFDEQAAANDCLTLHAGVTAFTLTEPGDEYVSMAYVVAGAITLELDPDTLTAWIVTVDVQEVIGA